jgi:hypothetical protein
MSMISHRWSLLVTRTVQALAVAAMLLCAAPAVRAQANDAAAKQAAEALFEEGRQLMEQRDFGRAAEKFEAAYQIFPAVGTLLNLGVAHRENGDLVSAWEAFERAADLARRTQDNRESYARERMQELTPELYRLRIDVPEQVRDRSLVITRDGEPVGEARWNKPFPVQPGEHVIRAERPGAQPFETRVNVRAKGDVAVVAIPVSLPAQAASSPVPGPAPMPMSTPASTDDHGGGMPTGRKIALGGFAVGALGLVAGGVFGVRASGQYGDAESVCPVDDYLDCMPTDRAESQALRDDARSSANLATVSIAVGLAAGVAGAVLWFTSAPDGATGPESARLVPLIEPGQAGVSVHFGF